MPTRQSKFRKMSERERRKLAAERMANTRGAFEIPDPNGMRIISWNGRPTEIVLPDGRRMKQGEGEAYGKFLERAEKRLRSPKP